MQPTRHDTFLYGQLKGNRSMYLVLAIVCAVAVAASVAVCIAAVAMGRAEGILAFGAAAFGVGLSGLGAWSQYRSYAAALDEIGPDPAGVDTCRTYSAPTAQTIARSRMSAKTLGQAAIAYGICGLMMLVGGVVLVVALLGEQSEPVLLLLSAGLALGGVALTGLGVRTLMAWRTAKTLESE